MYPGRLSQRITRGHVLTLCAWLHKAWLLTGISWLEPRSRFGLEMTISLLHWTVFIFPLVLEYIWVHSWNQIIFSFKISQKRKLHTHTIHTRFSYKIKLIHIFTTHINTNIHIDISIFAALLGKRVHHGEIKTVHTFFVCLTLHGKWRWLRECIGTLELCQGEGSTVFQRGNTVYFVIHTGRV